MLGVAEVETVESVNHLEAMSQWASLGRLKVPFHLYVPASAIDVARRMATDYQVLLTELWSYDNVGDQVRFTLIQRASEPAMPLQPKHAPLAESRAGRPRRRRTGRCRAPSRRRPRAAAGGEPNRESARKADARVRRKAARQTQPRRDRTRP